MAAPLRRIFGTRTAAAAALIAVVVGLAVLWLRWPTADDRRMQTVAHDVAAYAAVGRVTEADRDVFGNLNAGLLFAHVPAESGEARGERLCAAAVAALARHGWTVTTPCRYQPKLTAWPATWWARVQKSYPGFTVDGKVDSAAPQDFGLPAGSALLSADVPAVADR